MPKVKTNTVQYPPEGCWDLIEPTLRKFQAKMTEAENDPHDGKRKYRNLIAKWKKPGYESLCCLRCMQPRDHNFQSTCVCRVPKNLREEKVIEFVHCGCRGCASGDRSTAL
ncbi:hypothetical protein WN944_002808 [Citrus x changshan-huyou]|uniref:Uncharacterized protein n=1 Tax=Citrus x changshan-huyou TaxID=2935761 RepID=A0AAP0MJV0_9ROSI